MASIKFKCLDLSQVNHTGTRFQVNKMHVQKGKFRGTTFSWNGACALNLLIVQVWSWNASYIPTSSLFLCKPSVWTLEQEQRLETAILVCHCSFSILSAEACLCFGKRMWLQVKAPATQMYFGGWRLSVADLCHSSVTAKFCVLSCSFILTHGGIQGCGAPERDRRDMQLDNGRHCLILG